MISFKTAMFMWGFADAVVLGGSCMFKNRSVIKRVFPLWMTPVTTSGLTRRMAAHLWIMMGIVRAMCGFYPSQGMAWLAIISCAYEMLMAITELGAGTLRTKDAMPMIVLPVIGAWFIYTQSGQLG